MVARVPTVELFDLVRVVAAATTPGPGARAGIVLANRYGPVADTGLSEVPPGAVPVLLYVSVEDARRLGAFDLPSGPSSPR